MASAAATAVAAVGAASQSTSETVDERRLERTAPGGTTVDLDEWEAIVARCDKVFGRLLNRTAGEVAAARVEACAVFDALQCVTGTYVSQADQLARELRRRYGGILGPKAAAAAVTPAALVPDDATTDGGASEAGEGEPAEEHGDVPLRYDAVECGTSSLRVFYLKLAPSGGRSTKAHKYGKKGGRPCRLPLPLLRAPPSTSPPIQSV